MNFSSFRDLINNKIKDMSDGELFTVDIDKNELWDTYLNSFKKGTNPVFITKTEHDCNYCRQFIRAMGDIVAIVDGKLISIWDVDMQESSIYKPVALALDNLVKSKKIKNILRVTVREAGKAYNYQCREDGTSKRWSHFNHKLNRKFVPVSGKADEDKAYALGNKEVFQRGMEEFTMPAINTIIELIEQNSLYRGQEAINRVQALKLDMIEYAKLNEEEKDNYCWLKANSMKMNARIRNTSIGTLLTDLSTGVSIDVAVGKFESMVAPSNYKRPTALITKAMIVLAQDKVKELGIESALTRRHAVTDDITINNVLFADRSVRPSMGVFDELIAKAASPKDKLGKVEEVSIDTFLEEILPSTESIEVQFDMQHTGNLMSLVAPVDKEAKSILSWNNNFTWNYKNSVTDSMKERVKAHGGAVDGYLRFSIQWNDDGNNNSDYDAHCTEPNGKDIYFSTMKSCITKGSLDVDIIDPGKEIAVENITWPAKHGLVEGKYKFRVHNYAKRGRTGGFSAEIEFNGNTHCFQYPKMLKDFEYVEVAKVEYSNANGLKIVKSLKSQPPVPKTEWGITTGNFHKVNMIMSSPNHWDDQTLGNKHTFFIIEGCKTDESTRGFFNEFLRNDLTPHRKVFEVLGSQMIVEASDTQLSGLGFSSTQRNSVICKVQGTFNRTIKINF